MRYEADSVNDYLRQLPESRRREVQKIREVILANLPDGYEEGLQYGMIGYYVPFSRFSDTYNNQPLSYVALASQKHYISIYLTNIYMDKNLAKWFINENAKAGKKLNMGKSCVRIKSVDDVDIDALGKVVAKTSVDEFVDYYKSVKGL